MQKDRNEEQKKYETCEKQTHGKIIAIKSIISVSNWINTSCE